MKKYMLLSKFILFSISNLAFANPELEGEWHPEGSYACVDFDKGEVISTVLPPYDLKIDYISFKSKGDATGEMNYSFVENNWEKYHIDIKYQYSILGHSISLKLTTLRIAVRATRNMFVRKEELEALEKEFDRIMVGILASGDEFLNLYYFVESNRLYLTDFTYIIEDTYDCGDNARLTRVFSKESQ